MNRTELKQKIKENVYQNTFGEITGDNLQKVLLDMVDYSNKANDENFEKEEIVIVNPQGYYVPSGVKINDIGSNLTAGENIKIEDDTISAIGYKYDEDKNSISIGGGEKTITITNNDITEEIVVEGKTQAVGKNSFASGFNSIAYGEGSHAEGGGIPSGSIGMSGAIIPNVNFAYGEGSHAEGIGTFAYGECSHAEGYGNTKIVNFEVNKMTQEIADVLINDPQFSGSLGVENTYYSTDESIMQGSGTIIGYGSSGFTGLFLYNNESQSIGGYIGYLIMGRTTTYNDETMFVFQYSGSIGIEDGQYISWLNSDGIANGNYSHAEGYSTTASGFASHAEGNYTKAEGYCSHAEGNYTKAEGYCSHAEGSYTTASGDCSHAECNSTTASGFASHAEGSGTIASGDCSHAEGNSGHMNTYNHQEQQYEWDEEGNQNIFYTDNYNWEEGTNIINCVNLSIYNFYVGDVLIIEKYDEWDNLIDGPITTKIVNINNGNGQIEIDTYLYFDAQYTQLTLIRYAAIGDYSHREGQSTTASGDCSHAEGSSGTIASGYASHAECYGTTASGDYSHAEGERTKAAGDCSHAEGSSTKAEGDYSHAEGSGTIASGDYSHAEGCGSIGIGQASHAEGSNTVASGYQSHAEGSSTKTEGHSSHAEGDHTTASGFASHAEGGSTTASGSSSHAEGSGTIASGFASHAEGQSTITNNSAEHAQGYYNISNKNSDIFGDEGNTIHSIGIGTASNNRKNAQEVMQNGDHYIIGIGGYDGTNPSTAQTLQQVINSGGGSDGTSYTAGTNIDIVNNTISAKGYVYDEELKSIKFGTNTFASGKASHAEGSGTVASADCSHSEGGATKASGNYSHAEGYETIASGDYSHTEGYKTGATGAASHAEGYVTTASGKASHAEGEGTIASGSASHAEGYETKASNVCDHAEGIGTIASGFGSHTEGSGTIASGYASHAEGYETKSSGMGSHAEGYVTTASGSYSHSEGGGSHAKGYYSHAEGSSVAEGKNSHSEGGNSKASGDYSHAECQSTKASGKAAHSEGYSTTASGDYSHAEGYVTTASGLASHAGGYTSRAKGESSFVHGNNCTVETSGTNAHTIGIDNYVSNSGCIALGRGLTSHREYCTYLGQYNKQLPGELSDVIAVVGDGTDSSNKRNIVVIQSGNEPAVHCRGAFKNDATWINDFGEYFEWADGNPNNEDRVGYMVQLNENQIELAQSIDEFIGVISATAGFIGGACSLDWHGIYLRDVFGRYITDENGNPVINPEYDENKPYIPREKRPEWDIVGLLGQVVVRQDGTLKVGKYIDCKNGIATYADSGKYKVLKVINNDVALILIK